MLSTKIDCVFIILTTLQLSKSQRRISSGQQVETEKGYVVYLTKAEKSERVYDYWICGGAIVTKLHIITSAACVQDVEYMYAVNGYKKYVTEDMVRNDPCVKHRRKKVIYTCVPKAYEFDYAKIEKWAYIDIAVVKVESEFNFIDEYRFCDYKPRAIEINYDPQYQEPNTDSIVFGWGHTEKWRKPEDTKDYNQDTLYYATTLIQRKDKCKESFPPQLHELIDKYMICTFESGNINEEGKPIKKSQSIKFADGCTPVAYRLSTGEIVCAEDETRRSDKNITTRILERQQSRKQGICQNDHGGPLVTWVGGTERLIGVASVFRVTEDSQCAGPYLYTSTESNGFFLDCVINSNTTKSRKAICDKPPKERGFHKIEKHISWRNHPDGPAANELVMRPQRPIRAG